MHSHASSRFRITHSMWHHDYDVRGSQVYHVDNSSWSPGKPDLTFHAGSNTSAPVAGICKFKHFSSDTEIGLRDSKQPDGMSWVRLNRQGFFKVQYNLRMDVGDHQPHIFTWKSTRSRGIDTSDNLKLVDEQTRQVVAVFSSGSAFSSKPSQLDIHVNYGDRFQLLVLVTGLAVHENSRRARAAAAGSAGAAAGAGGGC